MNLFKKIPREKLAKVRIKQFFLHRRIDRGFRINEVARKLDLNYGRTCTNLNILFRQGFLGKVKNGHLILYHKKRGKK